MATCALSHPFMGRIACPAAAPGQARRPRWYPTPLSRYVAQVPGISLRARAMAWASLARPSSCDTIPCPQSRVFMGARHKQTWCVRVLGRRAPGSRSGRVGSTENKGRGGRDTLASTHTHTRTDPHELETMARCSDAAAVSHAAVIRHAAGTLPWHTAWSACARPRAALGLGCCAVMRSCCATRAVQAARLSAAAHGKPSLHAPSA